MEKIPAESGPWRTGVSKTCQVWPRSEEWKTRAARPPVANQMFPSGAEARFFSDGLRGAEAPLFSGGGGWAETAALAAPAKPGSLASLGTLLLGRIAMQELLAANA